MSVDLAEQPHSGVSWKPALDGALEGYSRNSVSPETLLQNRPRGCGRKLMIPGHCCGPRGGPAEVRHWRRYQCCRSLKLDKLWAIHGEYDWEAAGLIATDYHALSKPNKREAKSNWGAWRGRNPHAIRSLQVSTPETGSKNTFLMRCPSSIPYWQSFNAR